MKLRNWFFRQLAEKNLIDWKPDYYNKEEQEFDEAQREEIRKLESGEEIAPPWRGFPSWNNPARFVGNSFDDKIWETFWKRLDDEEKRLYLRKHKPTPEDWYQVVVKNRTLENEPETDYENEREKLGDAVLKHFNLSTNREGRWFLRQKQRVKSGAEVEPPWITFPISLPSVGWDDNFLESWKLQVWIPFWDSLSEEKKKTYLEKWPPPAAEWQKNITENWTGEIRKTEEWLERQKLFLKNQGAAYTEPLNLPRYTFPDIPSEKTFWEKAFIDRWLTEVWLPFWNELTDRQKAEQLKYTDETDETPFDFPR